MDKQQYQLLYNYLTTLKYPVNYTNLEKSHLQKEAKNFFVENDILFK